MINSLEDQTRAGLMDMQVELSDGININSIAQAIADFLRDERI